MKIVIEIDDVTYNYAKNYNKVNVLGLDIIRKIMTAIAKGKALPKGHGDLKDISYFEYYLRDTYIDSLSLKRAMSAMKQLPTLIEADKD